MQSTSSFHLTAEGARKLKTQRKSLRKRLFDIAEQLKLLRSRDNLSENGDLEKVGGEQEFLEHKFHEITYVIEHATKIKPSRRLRRIELGTTVRVKNGRTKVFTIVGPFESDPEAGKISDRSPLGKALLGKTVGEIAEVMCPSGKTHYRIEKIIGHG